MFESQHCRACEIFGVKRKVARRPEYEYHLQVIINCVSSIIFTDKTFLICISGGAFFESSLGHQETRFGLS
jgi:hypothetical protein